MASQLRADVYHFLRSKILSGELPPRSRIKEQEVAAQLDLSRTPVREALARLEMEGLVRRTPRKGAVVSQVELDEVDEIFQIRATLECLVAERAVEHATEAQIQEMELALQQAQACLEARDIETLRKHTFHFHALFNLSSKSPRLISLLRTLEDQLVSYSRRSLPYPGRAESAMRQHWGILQGLQRRDLAEMRRWIVEHAEGGRVAALKTHLEERQSRRMADYVGIENHG